MSRLDYTVLRQRIAIRAVLQLLDWEPTRCRGPQWRGPCPLPGCPSSSGGISDLSFSVHVQRNIFRCFRCGRSGNQFDLWMHATGLSLYPATLELCQRLSIAPIYLINTQPRKRPEPGHSSSNSLAGQTAKTAQS
jgi:hypothetical protein